MEQIALIPDDGPRLVSNREFAESVGVTEGAIRKAIRRGELAQAVVTINGKAKLDEARALELWRSTHPDPQAAPTPPAASLTGEDFASWRLRRERAAALQAEKDLAERTGELVDRDTVVTVCAAVVRAANARLEMLTSRLLPVLPGDPVTNKRIIELVVKEIQTELIACDLASVQRASRRRKKARATEEDATA